MVFNIVILTRRKLSFNFKGGFIYKTTQIGWWKKQTRNCMIVHSMLFTSEAVVRRCSFKSVLSKISQNSQENPLCQSLFLKIVVGWDHRKNRFWHRWFPMNFAKFLRTPFYSRLLQMAASVHDISQTLW